MDGYWITFLLYASLFLLSSLLPYWRSDDTSDL